MIVVIARRHILTKHCLWLAGIIQIHGIGVNDQGQDYGIVELLAVQGARHRNCGRTRVLAYLGRTHL